MLLHRELADLAASNRVDPFDREALEDLAVIARDNGLDQKIAASISTPLEIIQLALKSIVARDEQLAASNVGHEFVATIPGGTAPGIRPTHIVVREVIKSARYSIMLMGYSLTEDSHVIDLLLSAASRGVELKIACDRDDGGPCIIESRWDDSIPRPRIFVNRPLESPGPHGKMHCKVLAADGDDLLVTSANFTFHGMQGNLEFGVRLRDQASTRNAIRFLDHLIADGLLVPFP
jgi:hypothetical protein